MLSNNVGIKLILSKIQVMLLFLIVVIIMTSDGLFILQTISESKCITDKSFIPNRVP